MSDVSDLLSSAAAFSAAAFSFGSIRARAIALLESDFSPISISRRTASEKLGLSCCVAAHRFTAARVSLDIRKPTMGSWPVAGRPLLFLFEDIDRRIVFVFSINYLQCKARQHLGASRWRERHEAESGHGFLGPSFKSENLGANAEAFWVRST